MKHIGNDIRPILFLLVLILLIPNQALIAGRLDDFENDSVRKPKKENSSGHTHSKSSRSSDNQCLGDFFNSCLPILFDPSNNAEPITERSEPERIEYGPRVPVVRDGTDIAKPDLKPPPGYLQPERYVEKMPIYVPEKHHDEETPIYIPKEEDDDTDDDGPMPFIRVHGSYQNVETDIFAVDWRGELNLIIIGLQGRFTTYYEDDPDDEMEVTQYHVFLNIPIKDIASIGFGIGGIAIQGNERNDGMSFSIPIHFKPADYIEMELISSWSTINKDAAEAINNNDISDYDAAVLLGYKNVFLRMGYRWFKSRNVSLNGFHIGISGGF